MVDEGDRGSMEAAGGRTDGDDDDDVLCGLSEADIEDMQDGGGSGHGQGAQDLGAQQGFLQSEWAGERGERAGAVGGRGGQRGRGGAFPAPPRPASPSFVCLLPARSLPIGACLQCSSPTAEHVCLPGPPHPQHPPRQNATPSGGGVRRPTSTHPPTRPARLPTCLPADHMHLLARLVNGLHNSDQGIDVQALARCLSCATKLYDHMIQ